MANTANPTNSREMQAARAAARGESDFGRWNFVKVAPLMGGVSLLITLIALALIFTKGLNYGIDFAGGTELQVRFPQAVDVGAVRQAVAGTGIENPTVQSFGSANEFLIRLETPKAPTEKEVNDLITKQVGSIRETFRTKFELPAEGIVRVDTVGPAVGSELRRNGLLAALYSFIVILIYVAIRFDYKYAPGAVICLVHDTIVTIGIYSLLNREFSIQTMAAVLTLIGYSLNDTIVTFDRIRETAPLNKDKSMTYIINKSINDMLSRTFLTAGTTLIAVTVLFFFGGGVIAEISFTMIIGIIIGTYSSIYVAAPLILVMEKFKAKKAAAA